MVSIKLDIPEDFCEEEIRCNYTISKKMKEVWAIELDLLNEIIRVCVKYDIRYYAIGGTLLGAIRHEGFIPWDDDIDIAMSREDYDKLCLVAQKEICEPYFCQTIQSDYGSRPFIRVRNSQTTGIQRQEVGSKVPYNQGIFIDIFPWDNIPEDKLLRYKYVKNASRKQMLADILDKPVELTEVSELGALGATMCAGIGAGLYEDCLDAVAKCVRVTKIYIPDDRKKDAYEKAFKAWEHCYNVSNEEIYI